MEALKEINTKTVALTQNSMTKLFNPRGVRKYLDIPNPTGAAVTIHCTEAPWALSFDGGDHVDIDAAMADATLLAATAGSIRAWINLTASAAAQNLVSFSKGDGAAFINLYLSATETLCASCEDATGTAQWTLATTGILPAGEWVHVELRHDGVAPSLWVNGQKWAQAFSVTTDKTAWFADLTLDAARIGSLYSGSAEAGQFTGKMRDVRVYTGDVLTADRSLRAWYQLDTGSGTTAVDASGNSYDGSFGAAGAAPTWAARMTGQSLGSGMWFDAAVPVTGIWAYTASAGVSLTVAEGY